MTTQSTLYDALVDLISDKVDAIHQSHDMVSVDVAPANLLTVAKQLRDEPSLRFDALIEVCGVDYSDYGRTYWRTTEATTGGYDRGVMEQSAGEQVVPWDKPRFAVAYILRSVCHNTVMRMRVYLSMDPPIVASVTGIWPVADWFEREAFDLFGIIFDGHPDLRRILTDYGFIGHPFRKDFPLIGHVELRYDEQSQRCVYEPVSIKPRVLVPKVIRQDSRHLPGHKSHAAKQGVTDE